MSKTALITGGSSGIGFEMARNLAKNGYSIIILSRNKEKLDEAVRTIKAEGKADGYNIIGFQSDITDEDGLKRVFNEIKDRFNKIDMLILNAGVVSVKLVSEYKSADDLKYDLDVNLWGTILSTYIFLPMLKEGSKILIVSSAFGLMGAAGYSTYCASKAGVINFGESLRRELLHKKISVHIACPSDVDTPMYRKEYEDMPQWMKKHGKMRSACIDSATAAERILSKCFKNKFLITISFDVFGLLMVIKFAPLRLKNYLLDKFFSIPS